MILRTAGLAASVGLPPTVQDILDCHKQFGKLNWHMVKKAMAENWPKEWEEMGPGEGIFEPEEA